VTFAIWKARRVLDRQRRLGVRRHLGTGTVR
jgi:hypothetical protein